MTDVAFFSHYGEVSRVVEFFPEPAASVSERIFDLQQRHAAAVAKVFDQATARHASELRERSLDPSCLLSLVLGQRDPITVSAYPRHEDEGEAVLAALPRPRIQMAIDEDKKCVVFDGWGRLAGQGAQLLIALAGPFQDAVKGMRASQHFPFTIPQILVRNLGMGSDETLRRRVFPVPEAD
jgi:hypothetical protein